MGSAPDNPTNPNRPDAGSGVGDGPVSVPVDELHRLAQIFDACADDIDAAVNRLSRRLQATLLNRHDPDLSHRSVADAMAALRPGLRTATAQLRADAGLMAATAFDVVEADSATGNVETDDVAEPSPAQVDETAGWLGRVADGLSRPTPSASDAATGVDRAGADPVWDRVARATGSESAS